jgi:hypothetical protein
VTEAESVSAVTEKTVSPAEIIAEYKNAVGLLYDEKDVLQGNIFTIRNDNQIYFVTTFRALISSYSEDGTSFKIDFDGNNDILSSDLTLAGYSPLYNIAVLKPNNALDIPAFTLAEKDPIQFAEISVIGTADNEVSKRNIAKKGTITQDNYVNSATGLKGLLTEASCGRMFGAPVLDETDLTKVVAVVPGESTGEDIKLIPVEYIHAVLEEMSNPDTVMKSFPADELPEKFPYSFKYTGTYSAATDFEDIEFEKNDTDTVLQQIKGNTKYGVLIDSFDDCTYLAERDYGQTMLWNDFEDTHTIDYGHTKDNGNGTFSLDYGRPYYRYNEDNKYSFISDGQSKSVQYNPDGNYFILADSNSNTILFADDGVVTYSLDDKRIGIDTANKIIQNDFGEIPERLTITYNSDGYKIRIKDTQTGFTAFVRDDLRFGVKSDTFSGYSDPEEDYKILAHYINDNDKVLNMVAGIYNDNSTIQFYYESSAEVRGNISFSEDQNVSSLKIKNNNLNAYYYANGNMTIHNNENETVCYKKAENTINCGEMNDSSSVNGKGIKMSPSYYLIGNFERGVFDDTYYPFLLDWRGIP